MGYRPWFWNYLLVTAVCDTSSWINFWPYMKVHTVQTSWMKACRLHEHCGQVLMNQHWKLHRLWEILWYQVGLLLHLLSVKAMKIIECNAKILTSTPRCWKLTALNCDSSHYFIWRIRVQKMQSWNSLFACCMAELDVVRSPFDYSDTVKNSVFQCCSVWGNW